MERFAKIASGTAAVAAAVAGVGLVGSTTSADAAVVSSGTVNIPVPNNIDGVYMNLITGATGTSAAAVPGYDINPYSALAGQFNLWGATTTTWFNSAGVIGNAAGYVLPAGTAVSGTNFFRPGGGTNVGTAVNLNSDNNYFGVQFTNEGGGTNHFGFVQIAFGATAGERAIVQYAYESDPNTPIVTAPIPEPASLSLLALGAAGLLRRRSKVA